MAYDPLDDAVFMMPDPKQGDFGFGIPPEPGDDFDIKAFFQGHRDKLQQDSETAAKRLAMLGQRVFHAKTFNDDTSVEADYGAPARGLDFFKDLIHPTRSYRYTRVQKVEGVLRTHQDQARLVGDFLAAQGYKIFEGVEREDYPSQIHFANGGVTRAFNDLARHISIEDRIISWTRNALNIPKYKAAFLIPVPTYGLFYFELADILAATDVEMIPVNRNDDGSVCQLSLDNTLSDCRLNNKRILGYYDCNPHNPSGYIRQEPETRLIAEKLQAETRRYYDEDFPYMDGLVAAPGDDKYKNRFWSYCDKPEHGIIIIDDMAYEGLEYTKNKKPFSFGQVSQDIAKQTVVLKGISKIGMPGARIGMMIGSHDLVEPFAKPQLFSEFAASSLGVDILTARYSFGPHQKKFERHAHNLRRIHRRNAGIIKAYIQGLDASNLTSHQQNILVKDYAEYAQLSIETAAEHLKSGLPAFSLQHDTECGFFLNLNMAALKDRKIAMRIDQRPMPEIFNIRSSNTLWTVFKSFNIDVVPAGSQGNSPYALQARVTLSLEQKELFRLYANLRAMHAHFFGERAQIQLDLFRNNPAALRLFQS